MVRWKAIGDHFCLKLSVGSPLLAQFSTVEIEVREKGALTPVEIKSAGTFSVDFLRGLESFQTLKITRAAAGVVLYNGEQQLNVRGVRIFNPLLVEDIWETLTSPPVQRES